MPQSLRVALMVCVGTNNFAPSLHHSDAQVGVGFAKGLQSKSLFARGLAGEFDFDGMQPAITLNDAIDLGTGAGAPHEIDHIDFTTDAELPAVVAR